MYQGDSVIGGCRSLTSRTRTTTDSFCDVRRIESRNSGEIDVITDICRNSDFRSLDDVRGKCSNEWTGKSSQHNDQANQTREADRSWAKLCHVLIVCWLCLRFVCFDISQIRIGFDVESNLYQWIVMIVRNEGVVYKDSELQMKEPYLMLPSNRISIHKFMKIHSLLDRVPFFVLKFVLILKHLEKFLYIHGAVNVTNDVSVVWNQGIPWPSLHHFEPQFYKFNYIQNQNLVKLIMIYKMNSAL